MRKQLLFRLSWQRLIFFILGTFVLGISSCVEQGALPPTAEEQKACYTTLPTHTTQEIDNQAAAFFVQAKEADSITEKKQALTQALALSGISPAVRAILEKELTILEKEERIAAEKAAKPRTSFQAVSIPKQKNTARYGINMNELLNTINESGITKDPFAQ